MSYKYNPLTGELDFANGSGGGGGGQTSVVENITLTQTNETEKSVTLSQTPASPEAVLLDPQGGPGQIYGVDFTVSGTTLSWASLGLDGVLEEGDVLRISYMVDNE